MGRPSGARSARHRRSRPRRADTGGSDVLAAATMEAAILYWRWLGEEFPRYARAVSAELLALKDRRVGAQEAAFRIARLTQEYTDVLGDLPRRILEQAGAAPKSPRTSARRRQGHVID